MSSSNKTAKLTAEQEVAQSIALFGAGMIMGCKVINRVKTRGQYKRCPQLMQLMAKLNIAALEAFYRSPRSDPKQGSDFKYRKYIGVLIKDHKALFRKR